MDAQVPDLPHEVLLLCWRDTGHPQGGGSERYLERLGAELARRGVRVTLRTAAHPGAPRTEFRDGMRISRGGGRLGVYPAALIAIAAARFGVGPLAGTHPDVIVDSHNGVPFFATAIAPHTTVILVHHTHREQWPVAGRLLGRLGWFIESRLSPWVHRRRPYVTVSQPSADELVALGVDRERITVVRSGADPVPEVAGVHGSSPRLVVLSRLVPHKQIEDALTVTARLRGEFGGLTLDVIGGGWWGSELRSRADELGVSDIVRFHGHVDDLRKHELLAGADVHLMPSRKEGFGLAVIESAQHGVPTVGYRSSKGLCASIADGNTGMLVDGVDEMVSATRKLIENTSLRAAMGERARTAAEELSWEASTDAWIEVFRNLGQAPEAS
ncbi:glycosyltransferase family 4 protein [Gordonia jinhuaensis]|uniref:Glycosyl transferase n=1 Tax=Gordonia jinhuaensis TaxID=1517702 RepID=A0A916T2X6_9ACTN|nr:putative glycosyl transferase [Gordonia jinhuaensis]